MLDWMLLAICVGVDRHIDVDDRDELLVIVEDGDVRRADFLALDVDHAVGDGQDVGDLRRTDDRGTEGRIQIERSRLVAGYGDGTDIGWRGGD